MVLEESQLYRDLMRLRPDGWTANAWAVKAGVSRTVWTDMRRHGNPSRRTLEKLLTVAGSSLAEFEALRVNELRPRTSAVPAAGVSDPRASAWRPAQPAALPLVASDPAGPWDGSEVVVDLIELRFDRIVDNLARPLSLTGDSGAFALSIVESSMLPRFRLNRHVAVSPKSKVETGDDVLLTLADKDAGGRSLAFIAELVGRASGWIELRQFSPDVTFKVRANDLAAIHKIMGELI